MTNVFFSAIGNIVTETFPEENNGVSWFTGPVRYTDTPEEDLSSDDCPQAEG